MFNTKLWILSLGLHPTVCPSSAPGDCNLQLLRPKPVSSGVLPFHPVSSSSGTCGPCLQICWGRGHLLPPLLSSWIPSSVFLTWMSKWPPSWSPLSLLCSCSVLSLTLLCLCYSLLWPCFDLTVSCTDLAMTLLCLWCDLALSFSDLVMTLLWHRSVLPCSDLAMSLFWPCSILYAFSPRPVQLEGPSPHWGLRGSSHTPKVLCTCELPRPLRAPCRDASHLSPLPASPWCFWFCAWAPLPPTTLPSFTFLQTNYHYLSSLSIIYPSIICVSVHLQFRISKSRTQLSDWTELDLSVYLLYILALCFFCPLF